MSTLHRMAKESLCGVCGDTAPGHNLYGSSKICLKCRQFFRRSVQSRASASLTCVSGSPCDNCDIKKCRSDINISCLLSGIYKIPSHRLKPELKLQSTTSLKSRLSNFSALIWVSGRVSEWSAHGQFKAKSHH